MDFFKCYVISFYESLNFIQSEQTTQSNPSLLWPPLAFKMAAILHTTQFFSLLLCGFRVGSKHSLNLLWCWSQRSVSGFWFGGGEPVKRLPDEVGLPSCEPSFVDSYHSTQVNIFKFIFLLLQESKPEACYHKLAHNTHCMCLVIPLWFCTTERHFCSIAKTNQLMQNKHNSERSVLHLSLSPSHTLTYTNTKH